MQLKKFSFLLPSPKVLLLFSGMIGMLGSDVWKKITAMDGPLLLN